MSKLSVKDIEDITKRYTNFKQSIREISRNLGIGRRKISKLLRSKNIQIVPKDIAMRFKNTKHDKLRFNGNSEEKAYLTGLVIGDIFPNKKSSYTLRLTTATTHPAFINLLHNTFDKYGPVHVYPTKQNEEYHWNVSIDLDLSSFSFLLERDIKYLPKGDTLLSFLAGLIDSDGSVQVKKIRNNFQFVVRFFSQNDNLLRKIESDLSDLGFKTSLYINSKKGKIKKSKNLLVMSNKDDYVLELYSKEDVVNFLRIVPIKHPEKMLWKEFILKTYYEHITIHKDIKHELDALRNGIMAEVEKSKIYAKERYEEGH